MNERRILLVEDGAPARRLATIWLESAGYIVIAVADGRSALSEAERVHFDAMVVDMGLPDMDGDALIGQLKNLPSQINTPVVMYSGDSREHAQERARSAGCDAYVNKSHEPQELLDVLDRLLVS